jgi:hypothetical protein
MPPTCHPPAADIVESATHDHAAPTIMGIWGHTDPAYLHQVKEAAVQAVLNAEANARPAELWSATGTIHGLLSQVQGTDQMAGFAVDDQLPILSQTPRWRPRTGRSRRRSTTRTRSRSPQSSSTPTRPRPATLP